MAQLEKNPSAMHKTWFRSLGWEEPLEKGKATHSSIWPGEFHGLYSPWVTKSRIQLSDLHFHMFKEHHGKEDGGDGMIFRKRENICL